MLKLKYCNTDRLLAMESKFYAFNITKPVVVAGLDILDLSITTAKPLDSNEKYKVLLVHLTHSNTTDPDSVVGNVALAEFASKIVGQKMRWADMEEQDCEHVAFSPA